MNYRENKSEKTPAPTYSKKSQKYTPRRLSLMENGEIDELLLSLMPIKLSNIYKIFDIHLSKTTITRKRIRNRLNFLFDEGKVYTTGKSTTLKYYKTGQPIELTPKSPSSDKHTNENNSPTY